MKELKDKDFDLLFKNRITTAFPDFEEESWSKMERKLRKRDRQIFYRNTGIILLVLSLGLGFYYNNKLMIGKGETATTKKVELMGETTQTVVAIPKPVAAAISSTNKIAVQDASYGVQQVIFDQQAVPQVYQHNNELQQVSGLQLNANAIEDGVLDIRKERSQKAQVVARPADESKTDLETKIKIRRKVPISLALVVGPDFNSTTNVIGGKANLSFGVGIGIALTKKLSVQTGINYGHKNYNASADNYTFNNSNTKYTIAGVNAACEVIEIPLRASLNISENQKRSLEVNAGLSSYLMLKENYVYKYTAASGRADRLVEATNETQHLLSVIDLSVSYNIKLKNKKLALGIEPYVKIPLTGIGVGSVPLKSSGIALKLRYDFNEN